MFPVSWRRCVPVPLRLYTEGSVTVSMNHSAADATAANGSIGCQHIIQGPSSAAAATSGRWRHSRPVQ